MSTEYIVMPKSDYVSVCDTIRAKTGTTEPIKSSELVEKTETVYQIGYEQSKVDADEDFIGVKYSDFDGNTYRLPRTADARSLGKALYTDSSGNDNSRLVFESLFYSPSANSTGGYTVELETVYLPSGITSLSKTFNYCIKLRQVVGDLSLVKSLVGTFDTCKSLIEVPYMPNLENIGNWTFSTCTSLTNVKFYKKILSFSNVAFRDCNKLTDIYVPWAEGEVANAPWGATNATIHYNTTFDDEHNPIIEEV